MPSAPRPTHQMEVEPATFDTDPEGQALAAAINANLPPEVFVCLPACLPACLPSAEALRLHASL